MSAILTKLKQQDKYAWLNDVSRYSLITVLHDLDDAYHRFFKGISEGAPKFKIKKKSKKSFPVRYDQVYFNDGYVYLEKIGFVKYNTDMKFPDGRRAIRIIDPRVILNKNNKWVLSFGTACDKQAPKESLCGNMGIDMGVRRLATISYLSNSDFIPNINKSSRIIRLRHKLRYIHRKTSRIYKMHGHYKKSKHIIRLENQMRQIYHHLHNITQDYNHKRTRDLVNLCPRKVIMEDLEIKKLTKNLPRPLRRDILYASWHDFRCKMKYKCDEAGIEFILASKSFPSTQLCSECGELKTGKHKLKMGDHIYVCKSCKLRLDRDVNAARNLEWYGGFD
jgi:putative transposase